MLGLRFVIAGLCAVWLLAPLAALVHAHLDRAMPAPGSVQAQPPKEVTLSFTEALEPKFSAIEVRDAKGAAMQAGPATLVPRATRRNCVSRSSSSRREPTR